MTRKIFNNISLQFITLSLLFILFHFMVKGWKKIPFAYFPLYIFVNNHTRIYGCWCERWGSFAFDDNHETACECGKQFGSRNSMHLTILGCDVRGLFPIFQLYAALSITWWTCAILSKQKCEFNLPAGLTLLWEVVVRCNIHEYFFVWSLMHVLQNSGAFNDCNINSFYTLPPPPPNSTRCIVM